MAAWRLGKAGRQGVAVALLACMAWASAQDAAPVQWRWRDANGQIHVSDMPPPSGTPDKSILQRPDLAARRAAQTGAAPAAASAPLRPASSPPRIDAELEARRKRAEAEQKARAQAEEQKLAGQRAENCQRARTQLAGLDSGVRIARVNASGEREIMDDKSRAAEATRMREVIASDCR